MKTMVLVLWTLTMAFATSSPASQPADPAPILLHNALQDGDLDEAMMQFRRMKKSDRAPKISNVDLLSRLGNLLLESGQYGKSRQVFETNRKWHPAEAITLRDLARYHYGSDRLDDARRWMKPYLEMESPYILRDVIMMKRLNFVAAEFDPPRGLRHERFLLEPLAARHAEMDYEAVTGSVEHLTGAIGRRDWPGDLTLEEDRLALRGHEWEFEQKVGFVYTVLNPQKTAVIGCVYIYPSRLDDFDAEIVTWVTAPEFERGTDALLLAEVKAWLAEKWPFDRVVFPGRDLSWGAFFDTLDKQDRKYIH